MLKLNKYDLIEFFGALPETDECETYYSFEIVKEGLRLLITFGDYDGDVMISLYKSDLPNPILSTSLCAPLRQSTSSRRMATSV